MIPIISGGGARQGGLVLEAQAGWIKHTLEYGKELVTHSATSTLSPLLFTFAFPMGEGSNLFDGRHVGFAAMRLD